MPDLLETLSQTLGGSALKQISGALGSDEGSTQNAISAALPTLLEALSRNASRPGGAEALSRAVQRDHDGSILDNLGGMISGGGGSPDGDGILGHVLGGNRQKVERGLSQGTGMDGASIGKLLSMLAPVVMGALGKSQRENNLDAGGLAGMLEQERSDVEKRAPQQMGILGKLLDQDGDGDVDMGDIAKAGMGVLGKLLSNR